MTVARYLRITVVHSHHTHNLQPKELATISDEYCHSHRELVAKLTESLEGGS